MVAKKSPTGREYDIENGRYLVWHADVWEDEGEEPFDVRLPLRMKAGVLFELGVETEVNIDAMRVILEAIAPNAREQFSNMDLNDFQECFTAWQFEYELLNGATLGEAAGSPS